MSEQDPTNFVDFGFKKVDKAIKQTLINKVFTDVVGSYDLMNDIMSMGVHRLWKDEFCKYITNLNSSIIDVAGGTGDITFRLVKKAKVQNKKPRIVICDINQEMLKLAKDKAINSNILQDVDYVCADAEQLPFADCSFDYYTIAFGIRNVKEIELVLKEAYRILKPGGKFLCLEFSKVELDCLANLYDLYSFNIIPKIGELVAGNREAYQYLVESISLFPDQQSFASMISSVGFNMVEYKNLSFGVAAIHSGYKPNI